MHEVEKIDKEVLSPAQERFLEAFAQSGRLSVAAKVAGVSVTSHYTWRSKNEFYRRCYQAARAVVGDLAEEMALDRSINGSEDVVIHQGRPVEVFTDRETGQIIPDSLIEAEKEAGVDVIQKYGVRVLTRREYHDTLHALVLKGLKPETYRDRLDLSGEVASTLEIVVRKSNE